VDLAQAAGNTQKAATFWSTLRSFLSPRHTTGCSIRAFDLLFQWYGNGDVEIPSASPDVPPPRISAASAELIKPEWVDKAKELAGDKNVVVNGGQMARQCLEAGLLDEVGVELVRVVLGGGTPLFAELGDTPIQFEGPVAVVEGTGVTHLRYRVKK
jgi:hypothetical protein